MANEVCFHSLGTDNSWTLENYLKQGGYQVWKKILSEKTPADEIEIKSVTTQEAVVGLLSHRFLLDVTNKAILSNDIKSISALASASACFRLCVPNNFDALPDIRSRIVAHTNGKPL